MSTNSTLARGKESSILHQMGNAAVPALKARPAEKGLQDPHEAIFLLLSKAALCGDRDSPQRCSWYRACGAGYWGVSSDSSKTKMQTCVWVGLSLSFWSSCRNPGLVSSLMLCGKPGHGTWHLPWRCWWQKVRCTHSQTGGERPSWCETAYFCHHARSSF